MRLQKGLQVILRPPRLGENQRLAGPAGRGHLLKTNFQRLEQGLRLGIDADAPSPIRQAAQRVDLLPQFGPVDFRLGFRFRFGLVVLGEDFIEEVVFHLFGFEQLLGKLGIVAGPLGLQGFQPGAQGVQRAGNRQGRRGQQFAQDQSHQMPLAGWERIAALALQEPRDGFVQGMFIIRGPERARDGSPLGIADVLGYLVAEGALAEAGQTAAQGKEVTAGAGVLGAEGIHIAKQVLIDQRRQPIQLQ